MSSKYLIKEPNSVSPQLLDKINDCKKIPSKGEIPVQDVKILSKEMKIDIRGKIKEELCDEIKALIEKTSTSTSVSASVSAPTPSDTTSASTSTSTSLNTTSASISTFSNTASVSAPTSADAITEGIPNPKKFKIKAITKIPVNIGSIIEPTIKKSEDQSFSTLIRVGQTQMRKSYPTAPGFLQIPAWSRGKGIYSQLSPFFLGPIDYDGIQVKTFESLWQHSKVYKSQVDAQGNPTGAWYDWRNKGFAADAERHPMGKEIPLYNYFSGEKLGVVDARKKVYIPYYKELVRKTPAYKELLARLKSGQKLLLIEPDGPFLQDFPEGIPIDRELFKKLIDVTDQKTFYSLIGKPYPHPNNRYFPLGHGYVLADTLLEDLIETYG